MSGTLSICLQQQYDQRTGELLRGGLIYSYASGTTTPQSAFREAALVTPWPNPVALDAAGRVPQMFFADGTTRVRLTNSVGVLQFDADNIPVIGSSSGGGSGGSVVDPNALAVTGDLKPRYGTGVFAGWVRLNARTIGPVTSGATERANADCQALFQYLWNTDPNLVVIPSRGPDALTDWNSGSKQMTLPDGRGYLLAGLDDMGNTPAGRLTTSYFGANATVLGAKGGAEQQTLLAAQMPSHQHGGTTGTENQQHNHGYTAPDQPQQNSSFGGSSSINRGGGVGGTTGTENQQHDHNFATDFRGGGQPHPIVQPTMVVTVYIRL